MTHFKPDVPVGIVNPTFLYEPDDVDVVNEKSRQSLGSCDLKSANQKVSMFILSYETCY